MGVLDKFLNAMKITDDDGFGDDGYLDEEDNGYEDFGEKIRDRRIVSRMQEDDPDDRSIEPASEPSKNGRVSFSEKVPSRQPKSYKTTKVAPIRQKRSSSTEVNIVRPKTIEDAREITDTLVEDCIVILNLEGLEIVAAQRIIDYTCGSCYALNGSLKKINNKIFIITPASVQITGEFQEILSSAYERSSYESRY